MKSISKMDSYWKIVPFIEIIGKLGVVLFFVLSGFLITYLLLVEEQSYKKISIKKFYIRRMLRIWPLYFIIIILALGVLPHIPIFTLPGFGKEVVYKDLGLKIFLFAIFFPNLVLSLLGIVPYAGHTWSIGTEEQYYLIWPVILRYFKKSRLALMVFITLAYMLIAQFLYTRFADPLPYKNVIKAFWSSFNVDCMAIGGFFAILLFQKSKILKFILNKYLFYITIIGVSILMIKGIYIPYIKYEFYSVLFGIIIINFAANDQIAISLENKPLNYLGNISYGIYMYHPIGIVLSLYLAVSINCVTNWLLYPLSVAATIIIASVSFKFIESPFLKLKSKFSYIISGKETKELGGLK